MYEQTALISQQDKINFLHH